MESWWPTTASWSDRKLLHAPTHFPEVGFKPCGFPEDRDQLSLAGRRRVVIGKGFQMRPRVRGDFLIGRTGIFADPDAIGIRSTSAFGCAASLVAISA